MSVISFLFSFLLLVVVLSVSINAMTCPKSDSFQHAGCEMTVTFQNTCDQVINEITTRVNSQYGGWHDSHNNGTYAITSQSKTQMDLNRVTGDKKYTDKMIFTFTDSTSSCDVTACSESQVFSISDYSTNYCNLHDLYCNDDKCRPINKLKYTESVGKCTESSPQKCYTV